MSRQTTLERGIYFYGLTVKDALGVKLSFDDLKALFTEIETISAAGKNVKPTPANGYVENSPNEYLCLREPEISDNGIFGWLGYARNDDLPPLMSGKSFEKFDLKDGQYAFYPTSFLILPNLAILVEWNKAGPKNNGFEDFLSGISEACSDNVPRIKEIDARRIQRATREDIAKMVKQISTISFRYRFTDSFQEDQIKDNVLGSLMRMNQKEMQKIGVEEIRMQLISGWGRKKGHIDIDIDSIIDAYERYRGDSGKGWSIQTYDTKTKKYVPIDFSKYWLVATVQIPKMKGFDCPDPKASKDQMYRMYQQYKALVDRAMEGRDARK